MQPDEPMAWKPLLDDARWNHRNNPARASELIEQAIACVMAESDDAERFQAFQQIAEYLAGRERWKESSELYGRMTELLRRADPSPDTLARHLARHAQIEAGGGSPESAVKLLEEALSLWRASCEDALHRAASWYEELADLHAAAAHPEAESVVRSRAAELRIEASGEYYEPRVMRHTRADGTVEYAFHDVYFTVYGEVRTYTQQARSARMPSVAELQRWLTDMLPQAENGVKCGDLGYVHYAYDLARWLRRVHDRPIDYEHEPADTV